jgi:EAL and modified HD-GYP domain-containing signal transduction protein
VRDITALDVVVGRQSIFDRDHHVYGYELLFRPLDGGAPIGSLSGDLMTSTVLYSATGIGLDRLIGDRFVFCNADRGLLTGAVPITLPPEQTVVEVLESVTPDEAVINGCRRLVEQGFRLALDDFVWFDGAEALLELAHIVKVDLRITPADELAALMDRLRPYNLKLVAEKVETDEEYQLCLDLGFHYFQGYALARPVVLPGRTLSSSQLGRLRMASALLGRDFEVCELEAIISTEPGLTYQLLQMAGAGGLAGTRRRIRNVRDAFVMVGTRRLQNWIALLSMIDRGSTATEDVTSALTRAKMSELLAAQVAPSDSGLAFTAGMLSAIDVLMGVPSEQVLQTLSLAEELNDAAFTDRTPVGRLVRDVIDHLSAHPAPLRRTGLSEQDFDLAAIRALTWALEVMDGISDALR